MNISTLFKYNAALGLSINAWLLFYWFFTGAIIASAARCCADRVNSRRSWISGRSCCDNCKKTLTFFELIPIFSCIILRGRCKRCGYKFGYTHAISEAIYGVQFAIAYLTSNITSGASWLILAGLQPLQFFVFLKGRAVELCLTICSILALVANYFWR